MLCTICTINSEDAEHPAHDSLLTGGDCLFYTMDVGGAGAPITVSQIQFAIIGAFFKAS